MNLPGSANIDPEVLAGDLVKLTGFAGCPIAREDIDLEYTPAPHRRPSRLPNGRQAVYAFFLGTQCLKVGKAGPNTKARYCSQHYTGAANSAVAKSIVHRWSEVASTLAAEGMDVGEPPSDRSAGAWIERRTSRLNILIPANLGKFALALMEAFVQCRFQPLFEGSE